MKNSYVFCSQYWLKSSNLPNIMQMRLNTWINAWFYHASRSCHSLTDWSKYEQNISLETKQHHLKCVRARNWILKWKFILEVFCIFYIIYLMYIMHISTDRSAKWTTTAIIRWLFPQSTANDSSSFGTNTTKYVSQRLSETVIYITYKNKYVSSTAFWKSHHQIIIQYHQRFLRYILRKKMILNLRNARSQTKDVRMKWLM